MVSQQKVFVFTCADPERGRGLINHKNIGFLSNTGPDPHKKHKASVQCLAIIGPPAKRRLIGVSLS